MANLKTLILFLLTIFNAAAFASNVTSQASAIANIPPCGVRASHNRVHGADGSIDEVPVRRDTYERMLVDRYQLHMPERKSHTSDVDVPTR